MSRVRHPLDAAAPERGLNASMLIGGLLIVIGLAGLAAHFLLIGSPTGQAPATFGAPALPPAVPAAPAQSGMPGSATSTLNSAWFGRWNGREPGAAIAINESEWVGEQDVDRDGKREHFRTVCKWSKSSEDNLPQDESCWYGYTKGSRSVAAIAQAFEQSVSTAQRNPEDFKVSDAKQTRLAITAIRPGNYRLAWVSEGGDCGYSEYLVDGDKLLKVSQCKYGHSITLFTRRGR